MRPAERYRPLAVTDSLPGSDAGASEAATARQNQVRKATHPGAELHPRTVRVQRVGVRADAWPTTNPGTNSIVVALSDCRYAFEILTYPPDTITVSTSAK